MTTRSITDHFAHQRICQCHFASINYARRAKHETKNVAVKLSSLHLLASFLPSTVESREHLQLFEGPISAFSNYSEVNSASPTPQEVITGLGDEPESQIVVPSLLLLDGSSISAQSTSLGVAHGVPSWMQHTHEHEEDKISTNHGESASLTKNPNRQSIVSIKSLTTVLKRSSSVIRQVHLALRLSSTSSWRSSLSFCSSLLSVSDSSLEEHAFDVTIHDHSDMETSQMRSVEHYIKPGPATTPSHSHEPTPQTAETHLSEGEASALYNLAYEIQSGPPKNILYCPIDVSSRPCCLYNVDDIPCHLCGLQRCHVMAMRHSHKLDTFVINVHDYFGNTPLHFATASLNLEYSFLVELIECGADFRAVNAVGETFLHTLFSFQYAELSLPEVLTFLRYLDRHYFPFSIRDNFGYSILAKYRWNFKRLARDNTGVYRQAILEAIRIIKFDVIAMRNLDQAT